MASRCSTCSFGPVVPSYVSSFDGFAKTLGIWVFCYLYGDRSFAKTHMMAFRGIILHWTVLVRGRILSPMPVRRLIAMRMVRRQTTTSVVRIIRRLLASFSTVCWNGCGVVCDHRCGVAFVLLSFFDLCSDFRLNLFSLLLHAFVTVILLLEQVYQVRQDLVCLWWWRN